MQPIVITAATFRELELLAVASGCSAPLGGGGPGRGIPCHLAGKEVILAVTGLGKVNTGSAITALIERHSPRLIINTGCAGAYAGSGLDVGSLAVATSAVYGDDGVFTPEGWETLDKIGIPLLESGGRRYFNEFPLAQNLAEQAIRLAQAKGLDLRAGRFVTVSSCSGTTVRGNELAARFGAICEDMEGAAAAHVALLYGLDCLEIRGISNAVEDRDISKWNIGLAVENAQRFILSFIEEF